MRTEQKIFNDLIETIVNNSENNEAKITNVELWAKSWKEEMNQALTLTDVSQQRELLKTFCEYIDIESHTHPDDVKIDIENHLKGFNCG
jgi:predicted secreted acid phosphatase